MQAGNGMAGAEATMGFLDLRFPSVFRQVDLVNDVIVSTSGDWYPYRTIWPPYLATAAKQNKDLA